MPSNSANHLENRQSTFLLQSRDLSLDCRAPIHDGAHVMGILNVTPDSFSDGGLYMHVSHAVRRAEEMVQEGASILDIGGASSRPKGSAYGKGAELVSLEDEWARVVPVVSAVSKSLPRVWISVDTFRAEVAEACLKAGAHMINDITALRFDPRLGHVCAEHNAPLVLMHSVGLPGEMPHEQKSEEVLQTVYSELSAAIDKALAMGCRQLVLDPGFGFGKDTHGNLSLISNLKSFAPLGWPILIGVSRKKSIGQLISRDGPIPAPSERLIPGLAVAGIAVEEGAAVVRTHDVKETVQFLSSAFQTRHTSKPSVPYNELTIKRSSDAGPKKSDKT